MNKTFILALSVTAIASLSACTGTTNRGMETVHQPVVARTDFVFDLPSDGNMVLPQDVDRLDGWFESLRVGYGDQISVDANGAYDASGVLGVVSNAAARRGLLISRNAPVTGGQIQPGYVRVIVSRVTADVPECPDWSRLSQPNYNNSTSSNFGCSTNTNLARMVADPNDLLTGKTGDVAPAPANAARAVGAYRNPQGK